MKILVTGGAGFIGSNVVDGYIREGHSVSVIDNLYAGKEENINPSAKFYKADIRDKGIKGILEAERPEIVNHHAAQISVPDSVKNPVYDADVNILGLLNLLECSVKYGVKKIIFISSGGAIYGEAGIIPTTEEYPPAPLSPYAICKLVSEHYLYFYKKHHGLDFTALRYSNIYGPRQTPYGEAGVVAIFIDKLLKGEIPVIYRHENQPGGMQRDYCFVGDVVRANMLALKGGSGGILNIGTGVATETFGLYRAILGALREKGYAKDPSFDNPKTGPARPGDIRRSCIDVGKAENILGWRPETDIQEGIEKTLLWRLG